MLENEVVISQGLDPKVDKPKCASQRRCLLFPRLSKSANGCQPPEKVNLGSTWNYAYIIREAFKNYLADFVRSGGRG